MALLPWNDEEDKKDESGIKQIASVQSGWQPAPSGANSAVATDDMNTRVSQPRQSYLMSEEKAQADAQRRFNKAQEEEARRIAAANAAAAQQYAQQQQQQQAQQTQQSQPIDMEAMKQDTGWKKYYDDAFKKEKDGLDFWGRLMDGGAASRRAEVNARSKYTNELLRKAYDDNGNVLDEGAGLQARKIAAYNSSIADANVQRSQANMKAIGADRNDPVPTSLWGNITNAGSNIFNGRRYIDAINAQRQMSFYDGVFGVDDKQGATGLDDVFRFGNNLLQGMATAPTVGGKAFTEGVVGRGTDYSTGEQKSLNTGERLGRGAAGAVDLVGVFLGGSGKLIESLGSKVVAKTATQAEKSLFKQLASKYVIPALVEGGENATQGFAEYFGDGGALRDENGEFDVDKFADLAKQTATAGVLGLGAGGVFAGMAGGVNRVRGGSNVNVPEYKPVIDGGRTNSVPVNEGGFTPVTESVASGTVVPAAGEAPRIPSENISFTPVQSAPETPVPLRPGQPEAFEFAKDRSLFEEGDLPSDNFPEYLPGQPSKILTEGSKISKIDAPRMLREAGLNDAQIDAAMVKLYTNNLNASYKNLRNIADEVASPGAIVTAPVPEASRVVPAADGTTKAPVLPTEQVKTLQDSIPGKSQADEAVINQELQRVSQDTPAVKPKKIHPEDQGIMADFIDYVRGVKKLDERSAYQLELDASRIAERYELGTPNSTRKLANLFDQRLTEAGFGKPQKELSGAALQARLASESATPVNNTRLPQIDAENTRLFGDKASDVRYTDGITTEEGNGAWGVTKDSRGESNIMIDRNAANPEAVFHHEAVHKALNDFTTPEQRASVIDSYRKQYKIDKKLTNDQVEELVSDDFAKFVANKRSKDAARVEMNLPQKVKDYFEQMWQQIQDTYTSLKRSGQLTPEFKKLYDDLNNGKYVDANVINKAVDPRVENRYMVAGKGAKNFDPEDKAGRNFTGIEGLTRFELDDSAARITDNFIEQVKGAQKSGRGGATVKLGDVLAHDKLFESYPELKDIDVSLFYNSPSNGTIKYGGYVPTTDSLRLNAHPRTASELRATILHEVQHAIQKREGFARGLTPEQSRKLMRSQPAGEGYFRAAEEVESRLVESRANMSQSQRDATSFYDSLPADKPLGRTLIGMKDYSTLPQTATSTRISKEMAAAGTKPKPNKNPVGEPFADNLPNSMTPVAGGKPGKPIRATRTRQPVKTITPEQKAINDFSNRVFTNTDLHKDFRKRLARALGLEKDTESTVADLFANTERKVSSKDQTRIQTKFAELEAVANEYNALMKSQRKNYQKGKTSALDEASSKRANELIDQYGFIERELNSYVRKIQGKSSFGNRIANAAENLVGARNASILSSVGGISRNITQELGANILDTFLHPIKMVKATGKMPAEIVRSYKKAAREYKIKPKTVSEVFPWAIGNTYRTLMSPVTGIANVRKIVARESIAESLLRAQGETPTRAEIKKFAAAMGADSEVVANNMMGVLNGMTSHGKGLEIMQAYQDFIKTGNPKAKETFMNNTERSSNLAAKLTRVASESNNPSVRMGVALLNTIFPFVNTATNLAKTAVTYNLNPVSMSVNDAILRSVRSNPANVLSILKNKAVTYGVLGGVYALYQQDVIGYNDGEDVSKPRGIYIHKGGDEYFPVRATPIELPIAAVVAAAELAKDVADGNPRSANYYASILGNSLPYVDSATNIAAAAGSFVNEYLGGDGTSGTNDNGYAVKAYAVNTAKSFVPYSNNGITAAINSLMGKSTNAKTVYDKDMGTWLKQSIGASYPTGYRDSLKDSRDTAGRVRTVDQQGPFTINKTINDANTAEFNEPINELLNFNRSNGLPGSTKEAFNTYDTGKNNNFKSVQDAITFLDAPEVDGKSKPDNATKLEKNPKLTELSQQIYDGFYGDTGMDLLTLDGQQLKSDASVPNSAGTKNSRLPISMQSIKNAIAQTDLPEEQRDRMYELSQMDGDLWDRFQNKEFSYEDWQAQKAEIGAEYESIVNNSESYNKLLTFMDNLDDTGFFEPDGLGSTRSGQTYLWNALNAMLASKGATPAANYPKDEEDGWGYGGGGGNSLKNAKSGGRGAKGVQWTPVQARQMAKTKKGTYTPFKATVNLGNAVKKDKTQNYASRSF